MRLRSRISSNGCRLVGGDELQTYGGGNLKLLPCRRQLSRLWVDAEDNDVVRFLVRHEQKFTSGIDLEMARRFALSGDAIDVAEFARFRMNREDRDAVVSAI